jgi:hypothetical protein
LVQRQNTLRKFERIKLNEMAINVNEYCVTLFLVVVYFDHLINGFGKKEPGEIRSQESHLITGSTMLLNNFIFFDSSLDCFLY